MNFLNLFWRIGKYVFFAYLILVPVALVARMFVPDFSPGDHSRTEPICFWTNALVGYVKCSGFTGSGALAALLNVPYFVLLYAPVSLIVLILSGEIFGLLLKAPLRTIAHIILAVIAMSGLAWPVRWFLKRYN